MVGYFLSKFSWRNHRPAGLGGLAVGFGDEYFDQERAAVGPVRAGRIEGLGVGGGERPGGIVRFVAQAPVIVVDLQVINDRRRAVGRDGYLEVGGIGAAAGAVHHRISR